MSIAPGKYKKLIAAIIAAAVLVTSVCHCEESRRGDEAISKGIASGFALARTQLAPGSQFSRAVAWDDFPSRIRQVLSIRRPKKIRDIPKGTKRSVMVLVIREGPNGGEILLTKRSKKMRRLPGLWTPPGGTRDPDSTASDSIESISKAASRETREETHVLISKDKTLGRLNDELTRDGEHLISPIVVSVPAGTKFHKTKEAVNGRWLPLTELGRPDIFEHLEKERNMQIDGRTQMILMEFMEIARRVDPKIAAARQIKGHGRWNLRGRNSWEKVFEREYAVTPDNPDEILNDPMRLLFLPPNFHHPITRDEFNHKVNGMIKDAAKKGGKILVRIRLDEKGVLAEVGTNSYYLPLSMPKELPAMALAGLSAEALAKAEPFALSMRDIPPEQMLLGLITFWLLGMMVIIFASDIRAAFSYVRQKISARGLSHAPPSAGQGSAKPPRKGTVPIGEPSTLFLDAIRPALARKGFNRIELIAEGDNAYVYKASYRGRDVALRAEKVSGERMTKRRTALGGNIMKWILKRGHPNVERIYGAGSIRFAYKGRTRRTTYHVLEYIDGRTILRVKRDGYFREIGFHNTLKIVIGILEGLKYIHSLGLYYGSINSATNVMIDNSGQAKIIDLMFHKPPLPIQIGYKQRKDVRSAADLIANILCDGVGTRQLDAEAIARAWFDNPSAQDREAMRQAVSIIERMRGEDPPKSRFLKAVRYTAQVLRGSDSSAKLPKIIEELKGIEGRADNAIRGGV